MSGFTEIVGDCLQTGKILTDRCVLTDLYVYLVVRAGPFPPDLQPAVSGVVGCALSATCWWATMMMSDRAAAYNDVGPGTTTFLFQPVVSKQRNGHLHSACPLALRLASEQALVAVALASSANVV